MNLPFTLGELAEAAGGRILAGEAGAPVRALTIDSRSAGPGDYFVALKGERRDGHDFVREALTRGAAGAVVSREPGDLPRGAGCLLVPDALRALQELARLHRSRMPARVTAVTGSNGKTTTKEMLAHVLSVAERRALATRGNLNSQIGLPLMLLELEEGHAHAVLEMGASEKGNLSRLAALAKPDVAVVTNVGRAHLEFFGSLEGVLEAKWELPASLGRDGLAVLNADDPLLMGRRGGLACSVVTFGLSPKADVRAENVRQDPQAAFDLVMGGVRRAVRLPAPGLFNVYNALAAAGAALWERVPLNAVVRGLETFTPPGQRMQVRLVRDGAIFVVDAYNANPDSMKASLESFVQAYPRRPKAAVLGSMLELGPHSEQEHRALGALLAGLPLEWAFFLGPEGDWVRAGSGGRTSIQSFKSKEDLKAEVGRRLALDMAVLFKASRGVRLEEVYETFFQG